MKTYDEILDEMLERVPGDVDKREGSPFHIAIAPSAAMAAELMVYGDNIMDSTTPDTARGDDLTRKCGEHGVNRTAATYAERLGTFTDATGRPAEVEIGARFAAESLAYMVTERIFAGSYKLVCEVEGIVGNSYFGAILPLDPITLGSATLGEVLTPGQNQETDAALRARYYAVVNSRPFGGNIAQYEQEIGSIAGVDSVVVFPAPDNVGGRVHCVIVAPGNRPASDALIQSVQQAVDPDPQGMGYGLAPINHTVTISTVEEVAINVSAQLYLQQGYTINSVLPDIQEALEAYLAELAFSDSVVRLARIEAAILGVDGVADIFAANINGHAENLTLSAVWDCFEIPVLGSLDFEEAV